MKTFRRLTVRQLKFAEQFVLSGGNGTAAAIAAGYRPAGAHPTAYRLLRQDAVLCVIGLLLAQDVPSSHRALRRLLTSTRNIETRLRVVMILIAIETEARPELVLDETGRPIVICDVSGVAARDMEVERACREKLNFPDHLLPIRYRTMLIGAEKRGKTA